MGSKQVRKKFTEEQMEALRKNPFVYKVTESRLMLSKKFKELFMDAYANGEEPRDILEKHGFTIDLIGQRRMDSIPQHIFDEYEIYGEFHEGYSHPDPLVKKVRQRKSKSNTSEPSDSSSSPSDSSTSTESSKVSKFTNHRVNLPRRYSRDTYHAPTPEQAELKELRHRVDYLTQEVEFLKKITSVRTTKK